MICVVSNWDFMAVVNSLFFGVFVIDKIGHIAPLKLNLI
jgi:hypothetical protein